MENTEESRVNGNQTSAAVIMVAWLLVGIPLAWGVYQTLLKSLALFQ